MPEMNFEDWFESLDQHHVKALAVLGPEPFGEANGRTVYLAHPTAHVQAAAALCVSIWVNLAIHSFTTGRLVQF